MTVTTSYDIYNTMTGDHITQYLQHSQLLIIKDKKQTVMSSFFLLLQGDTSLLSSAPSVKSAMFNEFTEPENLCGFIINFKIEGNIRNKSHPS